MDRNRTPTEAEELLGRAQRVAIGLADTGLTQAEAMLHRVSPEGRAQARRTREARRRRRNAVLGQVVLVALPAVIIAAIIGMLTPYAAPAMLAALLVTLIAVFLFARRMDRPADAPVQLAATALPALPAQAGEWLDQQRLALPAPAVRLADQLQVRLNELAPQLARVPANDPAGDAVRKLLATELPHLVTGYQGVPRSLRTQPQADGRTPDAQLLDGLRVIDGEVARMTEQLARGALDEVATQGRYLELKYRS